MKLNRTKLFLGILGIVAVLMAGCRKKGAQSEKMPPPVVTVAPVEQQELVEWDEFTGRTAAIQNVEVRPRVSGHIETVNFQSGQLVKKGEVLFQIDPRWHKAVLDQRAAEYEQAKVKLASAEREARRTAQLLANKAISAEEAEQRESRFQEATAALLAAQAARDTAQLDLDFTTIRSPIDGRISRALITEGNYVSAGNGTVLSTIVSVDPIHVYADLDENTLLKFNALVRSNRIVSDGGKVPVELQLADETGFPHRGIIESFDNKLDPSSGGILLRAVFPNAEGRIVPGLKAAIARVDQSRSTARLAGNELIPTLDLNPSYLRERYSPNQQPSFGSLTASTFRLPLDLSYEIDLWGRIRRGFEAARADAQSSFAAFQSVLLGLQVDVARNYFTIRALDAEIATVQATLGLRDEQLKLTRGRFEGGVGTELDVARAETELASTEADSAALSRRRAELENALAILVGENPSSFKLSALPDNADWALEAPVIPVGLPAHLLERRPDVAESERQLAAANARIGVAKAAFFPVLRLTGSGGYVSGDLENLLNWDSRVWSIGPGVSLPIFGQARNRSNFQRSKATYEEAVARYRQQVLVAFGDVENSLSGLRFLSDQAAAQKRAVESSQRAAGLARQRYDSGIVGYLDVVDANRAALVTQRGRAQLAGERLIASVQLIKALGGGWSESELSISSKQENKVSSHD